MSWNHRITKQVFPKEGEVQFGVVEAFYPEEDKQNPNGWTENIEVASSLSDLEWKLEKMLAAVRQVKNGDADVIDITEENIDAE